MKNFIKETWPLLVIAGIIMGLFGMCFGIAYVDGATKSALIKEHCGVDVPWHKAMFTDVVFRAGTDVPQIGKD